jgi:uncharacterized protein YbjT (DUF2867 family)
MKVIRTIFLLILIGFVAMVAAFNLWGALTLGTIEPAAEPVLAEGANDVVMVFGATGSVGDGLLEAAINDPAVKRVYVIARRTSPRIEEGVANGKVVLRLHEDFTDYSSLADILGEVNTVLWGLGTSSLSVDEETYTRIHVDFPLAFAQAWLAARTAAPMSFHYVTGMGTDAQGSQRWARDKGRTEQALAAMAEGTGLRSFGYRSAFVRPTRAQSNAFHYFAEIVLRPGHLVITAEELGNAMLEISARTSEVKNGTLIDNADSIAYARAYRERHQGAGP